MTVNHHERLSFQAEVKQLLNIVVHSLYSNKEIFLRELISNASDAADKLRFLALSNPDLYESDPNLSIRISYDEKERTITINDNGIGMDREDVIENLGTIAKSGTREFLASLTGDKQKDAHLIGQFGVGFYSAFMVADTVTVITRLAGLSEEEGVRFESTGDGEYTIAYVNKRARGTDIILHLKEGEDEYLNSFRLRHIVTKYADHLNIPIMMQKETEDGKKTDEWETINRATAFWTLAKKTITEDDYQAFYQHIAHDIEKPLAFAHHQIEGGNSNYTCLLYLPSQAPFNFWQKDSQHGLRLYVQRVFIMDKVEQFLPYYLRFVRGVLDTESLPLNISREILQDHPVILKLRKALIRHVLDLLEKMAQEEPEKYATFWLAFGNVLKEGPVEDVSNRERIAKLLRFSSTYDALGEQNVSLADYAKRMLPNQKKIYYITAENVNAAKSSPHLEIFQKNDIEVLLLTDKIDEWLVAHLAEFEGKPLQSVAKGELSLDEIITSNPTSTEKKEDTKDEQQQFDEVLKQIKQILDDKVKEVRWSKRLTTSPACLVRDQHALGPQMERLLKAAGQEVNEVKPILELNQTHIIIRKICEGIDEKKLAEWMTILYEQALLSEGSMLPDPALFVQRMNKLWTEML